MKPNVILSLVQQAVVAGQVKVNLETHIQAIESSSYYDADIIVFPELSLLGYELDLLEQFSVHSHPEMFCQLSQTSKQYKMIVVAGYPLKNHDSDKPAIGSVICFPDGSVQFYKKQYLPSGEEQYCSVGHEQFQFTVNEHRFALAICADFAHPEHAKKAAAMGADVYLVSALISEGGYEYDSKLLSDIAANHHMTVMLSNHTSETGRWNSHGNNAAWCSKGKLVSRSHTQQPGIMLFNIKDKQVNQVTPFKEM